MYDHQFMAEAIRLSRQWEENGLGGPFGAVVVKNGEIIGKGSNAVTSLNDPTAHAEVMAIREACRNLNTFQLTDCEIYCSCEPCPMCLGAIYWARPKAIYFAGNRQDAAEAGFDDSFIYEEIKLEINERSIISEQHDQAPAVEVFKKWIQSNNKVEY